MWAPSLRYLSGSRRKSTTSVELLLRLVDAGDVGEGDLLRRRLVLPRLRLAEGEHAAGLAAVAPHDDDPEAEEEERRADADEQRLPPGRPGGGLGGDDDAVVGQQPVEAGVVREVGDLGRELGRPDGLRAVRAIADRVLERPLDDGVGGGDRLDVAGLHLRDEGGPVGDRHARLRRGRVEESGKDVVEDQEPGEDRDRAPAEAGLLRVVGVAVGPLCGVAWSVHGSEVVLCLCQPGASRGRSAATRTSPARPGVRDSLAERHMADRLRNPAFSARSRFSRAGRLADVGGSKRQALLAMLALRQGRVVDVDGLVDGLWGEELPAAPRNALHHHVARLRAALGEESIVGSSDGYALKGARVDAVAVRGAARGDARRVARRRRPCRGGRGRVGARSLARPGAAGSDRYGVVQRRGAPARDAARRRARGAVRGRGSRSASIASSRRRSARRSRTTPSASGCGGS